MIGTNADMLPGNDWGNNVSREQIIWNKIYRKHKHKSLFRTNEIKKIRKERLKYIGFGTLYAKMLTRND